MIPYQEEQKSVLDALGVNPEQGLTDEQVAKSVLTYGRNELEPVKHDSLLKRILHALGEKMILILIFAGLIALGVNVAKAFTGDETDFVEVVGIFVAIALSVGISVGMEGRSAKAFDALAKLSEDTLVKVLRNGQPVMLSQKEIVVGDIVLTETGDKTAADGRLIESVALRVDESALTGESAAVKKDADAVVSDEKTPVAERHNMLYSGCFVTAGSGKMVVTAVGKHTEFGKIAQELSKKEEGTTPLNEKLGKLGKMIALFGATAATTVFLVQLIVFAIHGNFTLQTVSDAFITSIVLIVAVVPEGLPTILAISLSLNIIKMSRHNALVKKLVASETIGCVNVICSDKTGTLTENKMTVTDIYFGNKVIAPKNLPASPMMQNFCVNSTADIDREPNGRFKFLGNPTECALLAASQAAGTDYREVRKASEIAHVYSFSSDTKNMTTIVQTSGGYVIYTKGSPEKILSMCEMEQSRQTAVEDAIVGFQKNAARVLAFAHKVVDKLPDFEDRAAVEQGLTFDGFVAISDPLRSEVYDAIKECRRAQIELMMLTGDNIITATAIANKLHLLGDGYEAVEARELEHLTDEELTERLKTIRVIARSTPIVKMRVVQLLKAQGNVVAVTGDGINDAPALKTADVGVAMGITGTEVSKEAADVVLRDDSFATIATSVKWGRGMYENFQRFLQFQLTVNLSSVIVVLLSLLLDHPMPFTALQLLWINLIMDGPPALTLGLEPIRGDIMAHAPTKRNASIVSKHMLQKIIVNAVFISVVFLCQQQFNFMGIAQSEIPTVLFAIFALFQLFNAFNAREIGKGSIFPHIHKNRLMLGAMAVTFLLQVLMTQFGTAFFGTVPLDVLTWLKVFGVSASIILLSETAKLVYKLVDKIRGVNA